MNTIIHADIFFFITSIAVAIFSVAAIIILYYVIRLMQHIEYIAQKIRLESDNVSEDIAAIRERLKEGESKVFSMMGKMFTFFIGKAMNKKRKGAKKEDSE